VSKGCQTQGWRVRGKGGFSSKHIRDGGSRERFVGRPILGICQETNQTLWCVFVERTYHMSLRNVMAGTSASGSCLTIPRKDSWIDSAITCSRICATFSDVRRACLCAAAAFRALILSALLNSSIAIRVAEQIPLL
jgi:hypothetical protein